jgi:hypothetical protein
MTRSAVRLRVWKKLLLEQIDQHILGIELSRRALLELAGYLPQSSREAV